MHGRDAALGYRAGASRRVAEPELPGQFGLPKVHGLLVGQHLGGVDVEPVAPVDAELARQPVRQVHQALVLDLNPGYLVGEPVVQPGRVGARVVERSGVGFGRATARDAIAVAHRAQRLPQPFLFGEIPAEGEGPGAGVLPVLDVVLGDQAVDELADPIGGVQAEPGGGRPVAVLGMADHDADAVVQDGVEGVLVGQVVPDEDRQ